MARRVFLHIGTMKSATTYLQQLASTNRTGLIEAGVRWPGGELPFLALADALGRPDSRVGQSGAWAALTRQFDEFDGDAAFSNELLAPLGPNKIAGLVEALSPAQVHVVITARDLGRVIPSHWQTTLKNGSTTAWSQFVTEVCSEPVGSGNVARRKDTGSWFWRRHDVAAILTRWQAQIPAERMTLVTVPPPGSEPRVVGDRFLSVLGVDPSGFEQPTYENTSLGASSAEVLRRVNLAVPDLQQHHYRWGVRNALVRHVLSGRAEQEPRFGLDGGHQAWVCARAERMIEEIRASSVRVVGSLDDLRPARLPLPETADPADTPYDDLLETALIGLGEMSKIVADSRVERARER